MTRSTVGNVKGTDGTVIGGRRRHGITAKDILQMGRPVGVFHNWRGNEKYASNQHCMASTHNGMRLIGSGDEEEEESDVLTAAVVAVRARVVVSGQCVVRLWRRCIRSESWTDNQQVFKMMCYLRRLSSFGLLLLSLLLFEDDIREQQEGTGHIQHLTSGMMILVMRR